MQKAIKTRSRWVCALLIAALIIALASTVLVLRANGAFHVIDRMTSPNGKIKTTVYNKTETSGFTKEGFTIADRGSVHGTMIYENAEYVGLWWSPDSRYYLVDMDRYGKQEMYLTDFENNNCRNLPGYLDLAMQEHPEFDNAIVVEAWKQIEYEFISWDTEKAILHLAFRYDTTNGDACEGSFLYDCETGTISDIVIN